MNLSHALPFRRVYFRDRIRCVDGHPWFQRIRRGNHDLDRRMENLSASRFGSPVPAWFLVAAFTLRALMKSFFGERAACRQAAFTTDADWNEQSITLAEEVRRLFAYVRHACGRTLSQISARSHSYPRLKR